MPMLPAFTDATDLCNRIDAYFDECEASKHVLVLKNLDMKVRYDKPPTMIGLAVYLGVHRDTLYRWMSGEEMPYCVRNEIDTKSISDTLSRARDRIESITLQSALLGDYESKSAALVLAKYGYTKQDDTPSVTVLIESTTGSDVDEWSR